MLICHVLIDLLSPDVNLTCAAFCLFARFILFTFSCYLTCEAFCFSVMFCFIYFLLMSNL